MALRAIVASFAVHAGVAVAGLAAAGRAGHATPGAPLGMTAETLEIDTSSEVVEAPPPVPVEQKEERRERSNVIAPPPDHTHPFPVPGHDARPHDAAEPHARAADEHSLDSDHVHEAQGSSAAPAAVVADATAKMPVFSLASGGGSMAAGSSRVAEGKGDGTRSAIAGEDAAANVTYPANGVSVPAKLASSVTAAYPPDARADDVEGDVGLEIVVDGAGRVVDARVVKRAGHGFDESALAAVGRYRFTAAQRDGRNVRVRMPWTVQFRLR